MVGRQAVVGKRSYATRTTLIVGSESVNTVALSALLYVSAFFWIPGMCCLVVIGTTPSFGFDGVVITVLLILQDII